MIQIKELVWRRRGRGLYLTYRRYVGEFACVTGPRPTWHFVRLTWRVRVRVGAGDLGRASVKRAALYLRVSTLDQNPATQRLDLLRLAEQRGFEIVGEYVDQGVSGSRARRPALDRMMAEAARGQFDVVVVWAADRLARSVGNFIDQLDQFQRFGVQFVSFRENIDTGGPLGRAVMVIVGAIAELERSLIRERVCAGLRRAKLEGRHIGRPRINLDVEQIRRDRERGLSLGQIAKSHRTSRTSVVRALKIAVPKPLS